MKNNFDVKMASSCVERHSCGTEQPIWLKGIAIENGRRSKMACFSKKLNCSQNCSVLTAKVFAIPLEAVIYTNKLFIYLHLKKHDA